MVLVVSAQPCQECVGACSVLSGLSDVVWCGVVWCGVVWCGGTTGSLAGGAAAHLATPA